MNSKCSNVLDSKTGDFALGELIFEGSAVFIKSEDINSGEKSDAPQTAKELLTLERSFKILVKRWSKNISAKTGNINFNFLRNFFLKKKLEKRIIFLLKSCDTNFYRN